jgi:hypothetical protein
MKKVITSPISEKEYDRTKELIKKVREATDRKPYATEIADQVLRLTDETLTTAFLQPLDLIKAGTITKATAKMALNVAQSGVSGVVRKIVKGLDNDQLLIIVNFLDEMLIEVDDKES